MERRRGPERGLALAMLGALGILSGWIWRLELEWRGGWEGLAWIGYFHWAVPAGGALFIAWAAWIADVKRRWLFVGALAVLSVPAYGLTEVLLRMQFASGPALFAGAFYSTGGDFDKATSFLAWMAIVSPLAFLLIWPAIPVSVGFLVRCFGARPTKTSLLWAAVLFCLAWPLAIVVRLPVEDVGSPDLIHAVKSGFIVPFLFVALGIPLLSAKRQPAGYPQMGISGAV